MILAAGLEVGIPLIVLAVTTVSAVVTWWANGLLRERSRRQQLYADAYAAVVSYQEFPFVILRRRAPLPDHPELAGDERIRISDLLQSVQKDLSNYQAQISTQSAAVSEKYEALVGATRRIAGGHMHDAWEHPALDHDAGMNIAHINYAELGEPQREYLVATKEELDQLTVSSRLRGSWNRRPQSRRSDPDAGE